MSCDYKIVKVPIDSDIGETVGYRDMIYWWKDHYEGLEHMHVNPEVMYTITSILGRCFDNLKNDIVK